MTYDTRIDFLTVVMILLGIINLLLFVVYALLRERVLRRWAGSAGRSNDRNRLFMNNDL